MGSSPHDGGLHLSPGGRGRWPLGPSLGRGGTGGRVGVTLREGGLGGDRVRAGRDIGQLWAELVLEAQEGAALALAQAGRDASVTITGVEDSRTQTSPGDVLAAAAGAVWEASATSLIGLRSSGV